MLNLTWFNVNVPQFTSKCFLMAVFPSSKNGSSQAPDYLSLPPLEQETAPGTM